MVDSKFRCLHISDVHWRGLTRHEEYKESFQALFDIAKKLNPNAIFIGGDIVHSKTQGISPELIDCLIWWFKGLAEVAPTHVILGNHDGLILNKHRQDAISPILTALDNPNIFLYKKSGTYPIHGIDGFNWSVFSCFDEENWDKVEPIEGEVNIATFHGGVNGSTTDIDWNIEGDVDIEFFNKFEFTFLGDIHKLQYLDKDKRIAYPGSTIQQNYGEDPGKGFLFWEIDDKDNYKSTFYEVPFSRPFVTIEWNGDFGETLRDAQNYPDKARFRVRAKAPITQAEIKQLHNALKEEKNASEIVFKYENALQTQEISTTAGKFFKKDLRDPATHMAFLKEYYADVEISDEEWEKIESIVSRYVALAGKTNNPRNIKWSVKRLEFDNTFSYGKNNVVDFEKVTGITGIFGKNRAGKSSIPGTLMFGLYNTTDRGAMSNLHVINMRKGHCLARVMLSANGKDYKIERQATRKTNRAGVESAVTHLNLSQIDELGVEVKDLNGEQRRETEKVLRQIVGTPEDFLMTSLASQGEMNNFIKNKATQRKAILTKFLDLEIYDDMSAHIKDDASEVKALLKNAPDRDWDVLIDVEKAEKRRNEVKRKSVEDSLTKLRLRLQELKIAVATNDKGLVTKADIDNHVQVLNDSKESLKNLSEKSDGLLQKVRDFESKLASVQTIKDQFPIDDLRERKSALTDLETTLKDLQHAKDLEKQLLESQKKLAKKLEPCDCFDHLPTCDYVKNSDKHKKQMDKQMIKHDDAKEKVRAAQKSLRVMQKENLEEKIEKYDRVLQKENEMRIDLGKVRLELSQTNNKKKILSEQVDASELELTSMRARVSSSDEAEKISMIKKQVSNLNTRINTEDAERISLTSEITKSETEIKRLEDEKDEYADLIKRWRIFNLVENAFSKKGIPLQIIASQLPLINEEISKILQGVTGFTVELETKPGSNDMQVYINYGDSRRIIECGSGMEKMMASLAIRVALINISSLPKTDLLVIDEGFGALDDTNIEACSRLLDSLKKWFKNIMVISHVDAVKDAVDNVLEITQFEKNAKVVHE